MKFIKRHKFTTVVLIILVIIAISVYSIVKFLIPNYSSNLYGNRLRDIEKYKIEESTFNDIKNDFESKEEVISINYNVEGKLINITINVSDSVERDTTFGFANDILNYFSDEIKGYYDFEFLLSSDNSESEKYPIFGYKNKRNSNIVWGNN